MPPVSLPTTTPESPSARAGRPRVVVGVITGTSIDGIDAAAVSVEGNGLAMRASVLGHASDGFPAPLRAGLRAVAEQAPASAGSLAALALEFARFHAAAVGGLLARLGMRADLVAVHGQTVHHAPPCSWQLFQPAPLVELLGTTVVCDLRQADLAAGGQGAPITPLADWTLFRAPRDRVIVNLGGFCNITCLPGGGGPESVRGGDVCACNQVLDAVARRALGSPYDADGAAARRGRPDPGAVAALAEILRRQRSSGRSLGTGDELLSWVEGRAASVRPDDLAASAASAIGTVIGETPAAMGLPGAEVLLAGGGARHRALADAIAATHASLAPGAASSAVRPLDAVGVPIEAREAAEMAILGALAQDGVPITLPQVTGRGTGRARDGLWCFAR